MTARGSPWRRAAAGGNGRGWPSICAMRAMPTELAGCWVASAINRIGAPISPCAAWAALECALKLRGLGIASLLDARLALSHVEAGRVEVTGLGAPATVSVAETESFALASAEEAVRKNGEGGAVSYLASVAEAHDASALDAAAVDLGRDFRRFNLPVKLALAAAHAAASAARDKTQVTLVSLSPCRPGSPELWRATRLFEGALHETGRASAVRVNPTYTLHAIDNLALSSLAIALGNRAPFLGLGGAPGQGWCALEAALEQGQGDAAAETCDLGGNQDETGRTGAGVALLFSAAPRPLGATGRTVRLLSVERGRWPDAHKPIPHPHAAQGLLGWLAALGGCPRGRHVYEVPFSDGDGVDRMSVVSEVA